MEECIPRAECNACKNLYDAKIDKLDQRIDTVDHRVDTLEDSYKQIHSLALSIERMSESLKSMAKELEKQGEKLEAIEAEPGQKWKQATWIVLSVILTAVITLALSRIGLQ